MTGLDLETGGAGGGNPTGFGFTTAGGGDEFFSREEAEATERQRQLQLVGDLAIKQEMRQQDLLGRRELGQIALELNQLERQPTRVI